MSVVIVIPARHASTRYPGKPLVALAVIFQHSPSVLLARRDALEQADIRARMPVVSHRRFNAHLI